MNRLVSWQSPETVQWLAWSRDMWAPAKVRWISIACVILGCIPALFGREVIITVNQLSELAAAANPYFQTSKIWLNC